jgi:hypothetical protein
MTAATAVARQWLGVLSVGVAMRPNHGAERPSGSLAAGACTR